MGNKPRIPLPAYNLLLFIDSNNTNQATDLAKAHPELLNAELPGDTKFTPLGRSAYSNNYSMCKVLLGMGADPNLFCQQQSPLMIAAWRNNIQIVELLIQYKATPRIFNKEKISALDMAALYGNYSICLYFIRQHKMTVNKTAMEYTKMALKRSVSYYVNYSKLIQCLHRQVDELSVPDFFSQSGGGGTEEKQSKGVIDLVLDPTESWGDFFKRILKCRQAPLIERNKLPIQMQPQNRVLGKMHFYLDKLKPINRNRGLLSLTPKTQTSIGLQSHNKLESSS